MYKGIERVRTGNLKQSIGYSSHGGGKACDVRKIKLCINSRTALHWIFLL